ncbi:hypothetical protein ACHAWF_003767 [Thalassiosira exigua]
MMGQVEFGLALSDPSAFVALHLRLRPIERRLCCERIGLHPARSMRDAGHLLASSPSGLSSKASSSDGVINYWAQLKRRLRQFTDISRGLPRSNAPRLTTSANDLCGRVVQTVLKWIRETCLVASALSLASFVLFSKAERAWIITNLIRWSIASCAFRLIMLQSWIASLVPSSARNENDDWFLKGSYQIIRNGENDGSHGGDLEGKHNSNNSIPPITARIRQVPGSGSCLFHAVASGALFDHVHDNECTDGRAHPTMSQIVEYSSKLRCQAVDTLASEGQMILQGDETITASSLVEKASTQYGLSPAAYLSHMRQENVWGGGPEIIALAHYLKRPIVSLEPFQEDNDKEKSLKTTARFGPPEGSPIYILSTNDGFPGEYKGKKHNHFLAVFPAQPF